MGGIDLILAGGAQFTVPTSGMTEDPVFIKGINVVYGLQNKEGKTYPMIQGYIKVHKDDRDKFIGKTWDFRAGKPVETSVNYKDFGDEFGVKEDLELEDFYPGTKIITEDQRKNASKSLDKYVLIPVMIEDDKWGQGALAISAGKRSVKSPVANSTSGGIDTTPTE